MQNIINHTPVSPNSREVQLRESANDLLAGKAAPGFPYHPAEFQQASAAFPYGIPGLSQQTAATVQHHPAHGHHGFHPYMHMAAGQHGAAAHNPQNPFHNPHNNQAMVNYAMAMANQDPAFLQHHYRTQAQAAAAAGFPGYLTSSMYPPQSVSPTTPNPYSAATAVGAFAQGARAGLPYGSPPPNAQLVDPSSRSEQMSAGKNLSHFVFIFFKFRSSYLI